MFGAIAGDICGSPWEGGQCAQGDFQLFAYGASFTDDTVCSIAIAESLLAGNRAPDDIARALRSWCKRFPGLGYGGAFNHWIYSTQGPYGSWGNGGAMRVAACGWLASSLEEAEALAALTAGVTHNHPEGLRGARAIAGALWLARKSMLSTQLEAFLTARYGYKLNSEISQLIEANESSTDAQDTVPVALICALRATTWEHAIELAARIGGDTDTIACMAGAIAEARFGLPGEVVRRTMAYLPEEMQQVGNAVYAHVGHTPGVEPQVPQEEPAAPRAQTLGRRLRLWLLGA